MKTAVKQAIRLLAPPLVRYMPISRWPGWLGRTLGVKVPRSLVSQSLGPTGTANVNILCEMLERTRGLAGEIADCGVFLGESTVAMGLYLRQSGIAKRIYGFDSFAGFEPESMRRDLALGGSDNEDRHAHGFSSTSFEQVSRKVKSFGLDQTIVLRKGYFSESFPRVDQQLQFCFAHLDVNLYDSYRECLNFFYPRMVPGGVILLDEYNDPPWPGCNRAVDEFLAGKPERLQMIERDNYQKWYCVRLTGT